MRELTLEELQLVAGGQDTYDGGGDGGDGGDGDGGDGVDGGDADYDGGDYYTGGDNGDVVVTGHHPRDDGDIVVTGIPYYNGDDSGGGGGGGGGGSPNPMDKYKVATHTQECGTVSGDAVDVALHVMGQNGNQQVTTSTGHTWNNVEMSAVLTNDGNGKFGTMNSAIYSEDSAFGSPIPGTFPSDAVGDWHNHPLRGDAAQQRIDEFPSQKDWDLLQSIADEAHVANPAMFITDGSGTTREFDLSDKSTFYNMTNGQLADPAAQNLLNGRTRTDHC